MKDYKMLFRHKMLEIVLETEKSVIVFPLLCYDKSENLVGVGLVYWYLLFRIAPKAKW